MEKAIYFDMDGTLALTSMVLRVGWINSATMTPLRL